MLEDRRSFLFVLFYQVLFKYQQVSMAVMHHIIIKSKHEILKHNYSFF